MKPLRCFVKFSKSDEHLMSFPNVTIDASIKAVWPEAALGCLYYAVSVASENSALLEYYANNVEAQLTRQLATTELADMPNIREGRLPTRLLAQTPADTAFRQKRCIAGCDRARRFIRSMRW